MYCCETRRVEKGNYSLYKALAAQLQLENRGNVYAGGEW
jgi:hypothetical protein